MGNPETCANGWTRYRCAQWRRACGRAPRAMARVCRKSRDQGQRADSRPLFSHQVLKVLFILVADVLNQLGVGERELKIHGPWLGVRLRIVNRDLSVDMPKIAAAES